MIDSEGPIDAILDAIDGLQCSASEAQQTRASPHDHGPLKLVDLPKDALLQILNKLKLKPETWLIISSVNPKLRDTFFDIAARNAKDSNLLKLAKLSWGHVAAVRVLLANGADANQRTRLGSFLVDVVPSSSNKSAIIQALGKAMDMNAMNGRGQMPLFSAVARGDLVAVKAILAAGADPNARDEHNGFPIFAVFRYPRSTAVLEALVAGGADIEAKTSCPWGMTPLFIASRNGRADIVCNLIELGADPNAVDGINLTPLHACSMYSNFPQERLACARELLKAGANVNAVPNTSYSSCAPLDMAAQCSQPSVIQLLLENGANLSATIVNGLSPAEYAIRNGNPAVAKLLPEAEAKRSTEKATALENDSSIDAGQRGRGVQVR